MWGAAAALAAAVTLAAAAAGGEFDLENCNMNGCGVGFVFDTVAAADAGAAAAKTLLPDCEQGFLLADDYFYVFGCRLPSSAVQTMAKSQGYMYSTDKSLTTRNVTQTGLLLANAFDLNLTYASSDACAADATLAGKDLGCVVKSTCDTTMSISVGCGSLSCAGCELENFFSTFNFQKARFETEQ